MKSELYVKDDSGTPPQPINQSNPLPTKSLDFGSKSDGPGASPTTPSLTFMQRISGLWADLVAVKNLLIGAFTAPGSPSATAVTVQSPFSDWGTDNASAVATFAGCVFPSNAAHEVTLVAQVPIDIQRVGTAKFMSIPAGGFTLGLLANTNEISIRRTDLSATASIVGFTWRG
jgi:hypothetical protein